ncbi:MAG TPA: GAF domain-containing sensor histidine kinase, partial [Thermomicrobiales bacterium]|nr:GAF domain-containing sensor histidine kinase [Thermomicrobiales bacterium]
MESDSHPIQQHRDAFAATWRDLVREISPTYREMGQARLRDRIQEGIDALVAPGDVENEASRHFLNNLESIIDQERLSVEEVISGMLASFDCMDLVIPAEQRYSPPMIHSERVLRSMIARFTESAIGIVTQKLEVEASAQRESRARLLSLQRVGAAVTSSLELESTLETIVQEAAELMNGATARLRLADEVGEHLRLIASAGDIGEDLPGSVVPVETTLAGLCYRSGRPVISNDVAGDPRSDSELQQLTRTRSLLSVPLLSRGTSIGVLSITNLTDRPFVDADAEMLSLFADHAAVAIENGRLFQQAQSQITEMEILNRVSAVVSASLNLSQVYRAIHAEIARIMVADAFLIFLRGPEGGFDLVYIVDLGQTFSPRHDVPLPQVYKQSMEQGVPFIVEASRDQFLGGWERYGDMGRRVQSLMVAPLMRGTEAIGVVTTQSYAPSSYRQRDADLLATVANVAAVAIENAKLYEQAHGLAVADERNRLAREIHDTIAQGLVGIILQLEALAGMIGDEPRMKRRVDRAIDLARVNLDEARRSVRDLRAAPLEHMSLAEAVRQLAAEHEEECDSEIVVNVPDAMPLLDKQIETALFRFVQESLTNCRKHALGVPVWVDVEIAECVTISVRDSGPGFDVEAWRSKAPLHHFGLHGMRERAERLGGALRIESAPGSGTILSM